MSFNSVVFLFFFLPITMVAYYTSRTNKWRNVWLFLLSLLFYSWGNVRGLAFLLVYGILNYFFARSIARTSNRKLWLLCGIGFDIGILFIFKYLNLTIHTINNVFAQKINAFHLFMPMGISFITFTAISYVVDVYKGIAVPITNVFDFYLYLSFFPKVAQGPISCCNSFCRELKERTCTFQNFMVGMKRFVIGLGKKCLIADVLGKSVDLVFQNLNVGLDSITAWVAVLLYAFQIYYDFSGYTDMAIGIGEMLGFHLPENFNAPYLSKSVSEFWRRWHMTLGQWFKTYIYIPLGGNRKGIYRTVINLAVVWALTGIWHGASYNYILWGIYYGVLVVFEKIVSKKTWYQQIPSLFKWFTTFFCVVIGWVMFRSEDLSQMMLYFKTMFGLVNTDNVLFSLGYYFDTPTAISFVLAVICCFTKPKRIASILENSVWGYSIKNMSLFIIFVFSIIYMVSSTYSSFIYFQF